MRWETFNYQALTKKLARHVIEAATDPALHTIIKRITRCLYGVIKITSRKYFLCFFAHVYDRVPKSRVWRSFSPKIISTQTLYYWQFSQHGTFLLCPRSLEVIFANVDEKYSIRHKIFRIPRGFKQTLVPQFPLSSLTHFVIKTYSRVRFRTLPQCRKRLEQRSCEKN